MATSIGLGSLSAQASAFQASSDRLIQGAKVSRPETDAAKIDQGSKEFEAVLVGSWLQQAEQSFATVPGADDGDDVGKDSMMSLGVQTLATSMAASGGIGIGKMVAKAMHAAADRAAAETPAAQTPAPAVSPESAAKTSGPPEVVGGK
jgi:Rod binding domain-containing protein